MTEPKAVVRGYHQSLWRDGDLDAIDRYWSSGAAVHMSGFSGDALDVIRADAHRYFGAFTGIETRIEDLLADGDKVVLRWTTAGDHVGPYGAIAATGKRITMRGVDIFRVAGDRIVECWSLWDGLDVYEQLGVLPDLPA